LKRDASCVNLTGQLQPLALVGVQKRRTDLKATTSMLAAATTPRSRHHGRFSLSGLSTNAARQPTRINYLAIFSTADLEASIERSLRLRLSSLRIRRLLDVKASPIYLGAGENAWVLCALTYHLEVAGLLECGGSAVGGEVLASFDKLHVYIPAAEIPAALRRLRSLDVRTDDSFATNVKEFFEYLGPGYEKYCQIDLARYADTLRALITYVQVASIQCSGLIVFLNE
jgi:hypothetical protein